MTSLQNYKSEWFQIWYTNTSGGSLSYLFNSCSNLKITIFGEYFCHFWSKLIFSTYSLKLQVRMLRNLIYMYLWWLSLRFVHFVSKSQNLYFWWIFLSFLVKINIFDFSSKLQVRMLPNRYTSTLGGSLSGLFNRVRIS